MLGFGTNGLVCRPHDNVVCGLSIKVFGVGVSPVRDDQSNQRCARLDLMQWWGIRNEGVDFSILKPTFIPFGKCIYFYKY